MNVLNNPYMYPCFECFADRGEPCAQMVRYRENRFGISADEEGFQWTPRVRPHRARPASRADYLRVRDMMRVLMPSAP